jgi:N-acyl-D-amino-acid deacylase
MKAGALGLSTGLAYLPGTYSKTEEIIELASVAAKYSGIYASHLRDQGSKITEALNEAIAVGERLRMPVQISHIKLAEEDVWNETERIIRPVEEAQRRGVEVTLDQYPYTATSSSFTSSFPSWCFEGGQEKFLERLGDSETYEKIKSHVIERRFTSHKGIDRLKAITIATARAFPRYEGKNLREILEMEGKEPTVANAAELVIQIEKSGGASAVFFQMDERDVETLMRLSYVMIGSDGGIIERGKGVPHPRNYGTFSRILGYYVRFKKILPLEDAVRKMTSLPAQVLGLTDRGILREGMSADIAIFDPNLVEDMASYSDPHRSSRGIFYVIVNGAIVVENGVHNGQRPGAILYGRGNKASRVSHEQSQ